MQKKKLDKKSKPSKTPTKPAKALKKPVKKAAAVGGAKAPLKATKKPVPVAKTSKTPPAKLGKKGAPTEAKKLVLKKDVKVPAPKGKAPALAPILTKTIPAKAVPEKAAPAKSAPVAQKKGPEKALEKASKVQTKGPQPKEVVEPKKRKTASSGEITAAELEALTKAIMEEEDADEVVLTDAEGRKYCKIKECDQLATVDKYCRFHYLLNWKKIQLRKKILSDGKLEKYIEDLTSRYPDKYIEMIRRDLKTEKDFMSAIQELEIDDSGIENEFEEESEQLLEEVRGIGSGRAGAGTDEEF